MIPRRRRNRQAPRALQIGAAAVITATVLFGRQELAAAAFTMTARGSGVAQSSIMPPGKTPTPTVLQASVRLDWAPSTFASGQEVSGYIVKRQVLGSTDTVQICSVVAPFRTCKDSPPPDQQVVYVVIPSQELWRGPASAPSSPVSVAAPPPAPALAVPSASPTPSPSATVDPTPTASATPSPSPTADPTPGATPTPSPS